MTTLLQGQFGTKKVQKQSIDFSWAAKNSETDLAVGYGICSNEKIMTIQ